MRIIFRGGAEDKDDGESLVCWLLLSFSCTVASVATAADNKL